jgi:glycosyltransferase A (GT-A) superfamily protein (DUF2064 family)
MAKAPRAGEVKTRLLPALSQGDAASLAACMIRDTVSLAQQVVKKVFLAYAPIDARIDLKPILPSNGTKNLRLVC